ncbi:MAG TPA: hypothetical protein VFV76_07485, partial [Actinomycetes bacterium]|nr:hypothetical protein [Actinomycetes bacterium]
AAKPATMASITADPALKGTSTVAFSGDVRNVTSSSVLLTVAGSTSGVAAGLSCRTAAGSAADCASGAVRTVKVAPVRPLVPGQTYVLSVTSGVVDGSGSAVTPVAKSFRASTVEQETSLRAASTWQKGKSSGAYGKRYVTDNRAGAAVSLTVRGSKVTWFTMTGPAQGKATVYVDGVKKARVDTYSPEARWKVAKTLKGLGKGTHQLRIVVAGRKSKASKGTGVVVDAVRSGAKLVANPRSRTSWGVAKTSTASGGSYAVTGLKGATSSFTFKGTSVSWVTVTSPTMGKAKVYVDGVLKARVDNFSKRSAFSVRRTLTGLSDGTHTVKVVVTGTKRKAARGTDVVVDKWVVG